MLGKCCTAELHPEPQIPNILKNHILISYLCVYVCSTECVRRSEDNFVKFFSLWNSIPGLQQLSFRIWLRLIIWRVLAKSYQGYHLPDLLSPKRQTVVGSFVVGEALSWLSFLVKFGLNPGPHSCSHVFHHLAVIPASDRGWNSSDPMGFGRSVQFRAEICIRV